MTPLGLVSRVVRHVWAAAAGSRDPNRNGCSYAVTVLTPILPGQVDTLRTILRGYGAGRDSPLSHVPDIQFARWVVIDQLRTQWPGAPKSIPHLTSPYLLFTADVTAPAYRAQELPGSFFRDLIHLMPAESDRVWSKCQDFPGVDDADTFAEYLERGRIGTGLYYAAYPDDTAQDIRRALDIRQSLVSFVRQRQSDPKSPELKEKYLTEYAP